ncbi:hypothetical protein GCM10008967_43490 [Bacillus carboniphilus]|uniref:DUF2140 domain-containing protein n=1 Tax=Bacillus carboniphilus TaxID=86663 RepID=A0ABP3GP35_9BACI
MKKVFSWKAAFWGLVALLFIMIIGLGIFLLQPIEHKSYTPSNLDEEAFIPISVQAEKTAINDLIHRYMKHEGLGGSLNYSVVLNNEVELYGSFEVFDQQLEFLMLFETRVLENGDLWLKEKSLHIGGLEVPSSYVLKFIQGHYDLPEWVSIHPADHAIYVSLTQLQLDNGARIKMKEFDLQNDDIELTLLVPKS